MTDQSDKYGLSSSEMIPQRMVRPFYFPPGSRTSGLPNKVLEMAVRGDLDGVRQILAIHPEYLNKRGNHQRTFLWEAARRGRLPLVQWLVEQGADVDATGRYNGESFVQLTPYCAAVFYRRHEVAAFLRTLATKTDIFRAAFLGDFAEVSKALAADAGLIHAEDPEDTLYYVPLLSFAIAGGSMEMVRFLLDQGAVVKPYSAQLLSLAAKDGRKDILEILMNQITRVPATGYYFSNTYDVEILRYLLDHGASASQKGENGFPPLIYVCRGDKGEHPEKINLLLEYGAAVNEPGPKGRTALHYAAAAGFLEVMAILLDHGADPAIRDEQGITPLRLARQTKQYGAADLLKKRGAAV